jgi:hypothetical protein
MGFRELEMARRLISSGSDHERRMTVEREATARLRR